MRTERLKKPIWNIKKEKFLMRELLQEKIDIISKELKKYIPDFDVPHARIYEAVSYSLFAGGKRLRPVLMLLVSDMLGGEQSEVLPFACAMEMIHTYSLIHDDLPAMDNDDMRRGKPTNHKVFGEAMAILAGDALLNKAFETVSAHNYMDAKRALRAINILSVSSGTEGMIGGQVIDMESENKTIGLDELLNLQALKTGAIIRSSGVIGAVMSGADEGEIRAVDEYCLNLGIAFQIQDDILDVIGDVKELGKPTGSDFENQKSTFVSLYGLDKAKAAVEEYTKKAISALDIFGSDAKTLKELANYLIGRKL